MIKFWDHIKNYDIPDEEKKHAILESLQYLVNKQTLPTYFRENLYSIMSTVLINAINIPETFSSYSIKSVNIKLGKVYELFKKRFEEIFERKYERKYDKDDKKYGVYKGENEEESEDEELVEYNQKIANEFVGFNDLYDPEIEEENEDEIKETEEEKLTEKMKIKRIVEQKKPNVKTRNK